MSDSTLAAELALGVLEGSAFDAARLRQREDPAFAHEVERWSNYFEELFDDWAAVEPPKSLERRIRSVVEIVEANDNSATPWKWATAAATSVAAALAFILLWSKPLPNDPSKDLRSPAPTLAVAFAIDDGAQTLPATVDAAHHQLRIPSGLVVPSGRVAQLWLIEGSAPPKPLGVFKRTVNGLAATITIDRTIAAGAVLAISIEPPGGSPTGLPTGPVVATGELKPV